MCYMVEIYELDYDDFYSMYLYVVNRDIVFLLLKYVDNDRFIC